MPPTTSMNGHLKKDAEISELASGTAAISADVRNDPLASAAVGPAYSAGAELEVCSSIAGR